MEKLAAMFLFIKRNSMIKGIWIFGFALLLAACNNNADNNETADSTAVSEKHQEIESVDMQESFPGLFAYLKKQDSSLALEKFTPSEVGNFSSLSAASLDEDLKEFVPYFIYNGDRSLAIDLYSYNHLQRKKEGKVALEMASPDSEVALINFDKKTRQRILFTGPSVLLLDARWTAPKEMLLAGAERIDDETIKPLLWQINLADSSMVSFSYTDTLHAKVYDYVEEKFKERD
jgi:hypothetical protein